MGTLNSTLANQLIGRILKQYGLQATTIDAVQKGYRNESYAATLAGGQTVNLIIYKREPGILAKIQHANYVSNFLAEHGLPARCTISDRIVRLGDGQTAKFAALYNYLPGQTIPWEAYTMEHIKQLGAAMSDMHHVLRELPQNDLPFVIDECRALLKRMQKYFADEGVRGALAGKLGLAILDTTRLRPALAATLDLPAQALHMDFVRGNILFDDRAQITGILDFEKTSWGPIIFDIARTLAFLLVDCKYKTEDKVRKYFLVSGYNKRGANSFTASPLLEDLIDFFLLHDFYKFLRHNPYESLPQNEHFVRTYKLLINRHLLSK